MDYKSIGVDYSSMDPFKIACQMRAAFTSNNALRLNVHSLDWTRGESAFMARIGDFVFSHVDEGLGTKNLVADAMALITGKSHYNKISQDTIAMTANDKITLGCLPIMLSMHLSVGSSDWFKDEQRVESLIRGWGDACDLSGCIWSGGETPTLLDLLYPTAAVLSCSSFGINMADFNPIRIVDGDAIVILESSGIHANYLTMARRIAAKLPDGYATLMSDGRMYGEALLDPTHIYVKFIEQCINAGVDIHYAVNITGHGFRKFMRAKQPFSYVIEELPNQLPIFDFIQEKGGIDDVEAYGNMNMGAGFALYLPESEIIKIPHLLDLPFRVYRAGYVEASEESRVIIKPKGLEFKAETLALR